MICISVKSNVNLWAKKYAKLVEQFYEQNKIINIIQSFLSYFDNKINKFINSIKSHFNVSGQFIIFEVSTNIFEFETNDQSYQQIIFNTSVNNVLNMHMCKRLILKLLTAISNVTFNDSYPKPNIFFIYHSTKHFFK